MRGPWLLLMLAASGCSFDYNALKGRSSGSGGSDAASPDVSRVADVAGDRTMDVATPDISRADGVADVAIDAGLDVPPSADVSRDNRAGTGGAGSGGITASGGRGGTGGVTSAGGAGGSAATGGTSGIGTGGRVGTGGLIATGGISSTGGTVTGGVLGTGGTTTGGITGTGGTATGGAVGTGGSPGTGGSNVDAGTAGCMELFTNATEFATATQSSTTLVEDFTKDATGAPVPSDFFAVTDGTHYQRSAAVSFQSIGVQPGNDPGVTDGRVVGSYGSIVSFSGSVSARDGIIATFATPQVGVGLVLNDDEGTQASTLEVATADQRFSFSVPTASATFAGVVSHCGGAIVSVRVLPPVPSHWWRLRSVAFAGLGGTDH